MMLEGANRNNPRGLKYNQERTLLYREKGFWGDATLLDCWDASVLRYPEKKAVIDSHGAWLSFRKADALASRIAFFLKDRGVEPGDRVSFQLPGWAEFLPICIACLKAGAVLSPIPTNLRFEEARYFLEQCGSKVLFLPHYYRHYFYEEMEARLRACLPGLETVITVDKFRQGGKGPMLEHIISASRSLTPEEITAIQRNSVHADQVMTILFTSGSEGRAKGVMLSHNNIIASESVFAAHFGISQYDVMLMPAPITHATGFLHGLIMPFVQGATTVLQDEFNAERTLELLREHRCTVSMASEPFLHDMVGVLERGVWDVGSLRFFICGGSSVSPPLIEKALGHGILTLNVYGSTESIGHVGVLPGMDSERRLHTSGRPFPGVEVRVVDKNRRPVPPGVEGEEASRGPQVFLGYLNSPELTDNALEEERRYYR